MLEDDNEKEHWSSIITVLGMIGDPRATDPFIEFLERRFEGKVDATTWDGLLPVLPVLGFLGIEPDSKAFQYLRESWRQSYWKECILKWSYPSIKIDDRNIQLAKLSINGLGIAASKEAEEQ